MPKQPLSATAQAVHTKLLTQRFPTSPSATYSPILYSTLPIENTFLFEGIQQANGHRQQDDH
jgi:hypothetical protein